MGSSKIMSCLSGNSNLSFLVLYISSRQAVVAFWQSSHRPLGYGLFRACWLFLTVWNFQSAFDTGHKYSFILLKSPSKLDFEIQCTWKQWNTKWYYNLLYLKIIILDSIPLWEWMWCHCIFHFRQGWKMHTIHWYRLEIPEPTPSLFQHGAQIGGIWVFPAIKITVICQVRMYCGLRVKVDMPKTLYSARRSWMHFVCICFYVCGWQKPEYPQLELYG